MISRALSLFRNSREQFRSKQKRTQNKTGQKYFTRISGWGLYRLLGLPSLCQFRVRTPMLSPFFVTFRDLTTRSPPAILQV